MTYDEYEEGKRFRQMHDTIRALKSSLSPEPADTGISPMEAFARSYDKLNAAQVRRILNEVDVGDVDTKALGRVGSARARLSETLLTDAQKAFETDALALALAKIASADPGTQDRLAAVIRILLLAQVALTAILKAIDLWQEAAARTFVEALKAAGIGDPVVLKKVGDYNI